DGVQIDQVVLSPASYISASPGQVSNDTTILAKTAAATGPYSGSPAPLPGQINAETFDNGGEGVAYHDTSSGNNGGQARATDVDIERASEGGYDIGWISAGEWVNYTVNVAAAGSYDLQFRVATATGASMRAIFAGSSSVSATVAIPATGGWQNWATVTVPVTLGAGRQVMTLMFDTGWMNFRYMNAVANAPAAPPPSTTTPYTGTPINLPGTIEAENFDNGGEGIAYHDTTPANQGAAYRSTAVDLEPSSGGGFDVGWVAAGEWLNYTVNVTSSGSYTAQLRVASLSAQTVHIGFNGSSVWTSVNVPASGGWQTW